VFTSLRRPAARWAVVAGLVLLAACGGDDAGLDATVDATPTEPTTDGEGSQEAVEPTDDEDVDGDGATGVVVLEPVATDGADPFTATVAAALTPAVEAFVASAGELAAAAGDGAAGAAEGGGAAVDGAVTALVSLDGTEPGLYGGTRQAASCDPDQLVAFLEDDPDKGAAWADVQGIDPADIGGYVDGLTPLLLPADTRVTNHGFAGSVATPRQSVLQTGTAVMVDELGVPRVRCSCGNPLAEPEPVEGTTSYRGDAWDAFTPDDLAAVAPGDEPVDTFVVLDVESGEEFLRPAGSTGDDDRATTPDQVTATGAVTGVPPESGTVAESAVSITFPPAGGEVTGTMDIVFTGEGITVSSAIELTGSFDPASSTMSGPATGTVEVPGVGARNTGGGSWTATVDPASGTLTGTLTGEDGAAGTFEATFEPYGPPG
jgi:hypothetical protein